MKEIRHSVTLRASPKLLFEALTEERHISQWWTPDCSLRAVEGSQAIFHWRSNKWMVVMRIAKLTPEKEVVWQCEASNMQNTDAWVGTELRFAITPVDKKQTTLEFVQSNYPDSPCYQACNDGWGRILGDSLKGYLEMGIGRSFSYHG